MRSLLKQNPETPLNISNRDLDAPSKIPTETPFETPPRQPKTPFLFPTTHPAFRKKTPPPTPDPKDLPKARAYPIPNLVRLLADRDCERAVNYAVAGPRLSRDLGYIRIGDFEEVRVGSGRFGGGEKSGR